MKTPESETVRKMFGEVAPKYDLANTVLSLGIHHLWRRKLVRWSGVRSTDRVLDCASGTGDLAFEFEKIASEVVATDFCEEMLDYARQKALRSESQISFDVADVTQLKYANESFDIASISFGIRNVNDPLKALMELGRVVKPGGSVMVLEFGQPELPILSGAYRFYSTQVLPVIGGWVSGQRKAYEYLQSSSAEFPCAEEFIDLAESAEMFTSCEFHPVSGGIAYIYKLIRGANQ